MKQNLSDDTDSAVITDAQPHILKVKVSKNDADSTSYNQAFNILYDKKWWQAMENELNALENDIRA